LFVIVILPVFFWHCVVIGSRLAWIGKAVSGLACFGGYVRNANGPTNAGRSVLILGFFGCGGRQPPSVACSILLGLKRTRNLQVMNRIEQTMKL
jgi:hypothetical protein